MLHKVETFLDEDLVLVNGKKVPGLVVTCGLCDKCVSMAGANTPANVNILLQLLHKDCPEKLPNRYVVVSEI
jgi:hypothetical protein